MVEIQCAATSYYERELLDALPLSAPKGHPSAGLRYGGAGRAVKAFPVAEECSTDERIGQVGVAHNNSGCTRKKSQSGSLMRTAEFVHLYEEDYDSHEENGPVHESLRGGVRSPCKKDQAEVNL